MVIMFMPRGCSCALILLSAPQVMGNNADVHDLNDLSTSRFGPSSVGFFYGKQRLWHWKYFSFLFCFIHDARRLHKLKHVWKLGEEKRFELCTFSSCYSYTFVWLCVKGGALFYLSLEVKFALHCCKTVLLWKENCVFMTSKSDCVNNKENNQVLNSPPHEDI